jgi:hypothetical protein
MFFNLCLDIFIIIILIGELIQFFIQLNSPSEFSEIIEVEE